MFRRAMSFDYSDILKLAFVLVLTPSLCLCQHEHDIFRHLVNNTNNMYIHKIAVWNAVNRIFALIISPIEYVRFEANLTTIHVLSDDGVIIELDRNCHFRARKDNDYIEYDPRASSYSHWQNEYDIRIREKADLHGEHYWNYETFYDREKNSYRLGTNAITVLARVRKGQFEEPIVEQKSCGDKKCNASMFMHFRSDSAMVYIRYIPETEAIWKCRWSRDRNFHLYSDESALITYDNNGITKIATESAYITVNSFRPVLKIVRRFFKLTTNDYMATVNYELGTVTFDADLNEKSLITELKNGRIMANWAGANRNPEVYCQNRNSNTNIKVRRGGFTARYSAGMVDYNHVKKSITVYDETTDGTVWLTVLIGTPKIYANLPSLIITELPGVPGLYRWETKKGGFLVELNENNTAVEIRSKGLNFSMKMESDNEVRVGSNIMSWEKDFSAIYCCDLYAAASNKSLRFSFNAGNPERMDVEISDNGWMWNMGKTVITF